MGEIQKIFFLLFFITSQVSAQKVYFPTDTWGVFRGMAEMDMQTDVITYLGTHDYGIDCNSMGVNIDGELYGNMSGDFFKYNLATLDTTFLFYFDPSKTSSNGIVFDKNGIGYGGGVTILGKPNLFGFYKFDIEKKQVDYLGEISHQISDLTFRKGKMYGVTYSDSIVVVNLKQPINSKLELYFPIQHNYDSVWQMTSMFTINYRCDSMDTYVVDQGDWTDEAQTPFAESVVYKVNFQDKTLESIANVPYSLLDAATTGEFLPEKCVISIDLDRDNSTGVIDDDYDGEMNCGWKFPIADDDVRIRNDYNEPFDSVDIVSIGTLPDGLNESIVEKIGSNAFSIRTIGNNTWRVTPDIKVSNLQWEAYISQLYYTNALELNATKGNRVFDIRGYYAYDTSHAKSTLYLKEKADAGPDQYIDICKDGAPIELKTKLINGTDLTGWFQPNLTYYDPRFNIETTFQYIVNDEGRKCPDSTTIHIVLQNSPEIILRDTAVCKFPTTVSASVKGSYDKIVWDNGEQNLITTVDEEGNYIFSAENKGCKSDQSINVRYESPNRILVADTVKYCIGTSILITPTITGIVDSLKWNTGQVSKDIEVFKEGIYSLTVYSKDCILTRETFVDEDPCLRARVYLPNVFSPNYDGINDEFIPDLINAEPLELKIFDRWGAQLFSSDGKKGWDGEFKGNSITPGVYTYIFRYKDLIKQTEVLVKGDLTLVR